ncbi:hypothetical protein COP1_045495 [Malus domestica]
MCRASEDDLPLSLEVRRALTALIRQVEEQIVQLHERRNEAIAVLGSREDDQDSEDGSDSEDDPGWEYDLDLEDEDDQGSEDDQDSEDGQDSEDDLSQSQEFWFFFIIMYGVQVQCKWRPKRVRDEDRKSRNTKERPFSLPRIYLAKERRIRWRSQP